MNTILCFNFLNNEGSEFLKISSINFQMKSYLECQSIKQIKGSQLWIKLDWEAEHFSLVIFSILEQQPLSHFIETLKFAEPLESHWTLMIFLSLIFFFN